MSKHDFIIPKLDRDKKEVKIETSVKENEVITETKTPDYFVSPSGKHLNKISVIDASRGNPTQYDFLKGKQMMDLSLVSVGKDNDKPVVFGNGQKPTQVDNINKNYQNVNESFEKEITNETLKEEIEEISSSEESSKIEIEPIEEEKEYVEPVINPATRITVNHEDELLHRNVHHRHKKYVTPNPKELPVSNGITEDDQMWQEQQKAIINQVFRDFQVKAEVVGMIPGPTVTQFLINLEPGVHINNITKLESNIQLSLALPKDHNIRVIQQVPNKPYAGIEVPNRKRKTVLLGDLINSKEFKEYPGKLPIAVGLDVSGKKVFVDITEMPHCLIAGTTKSGKSVSLNTIILSLIYSCSPEYLRLILIDPKIVELSTYKGIPHLAMPVITDFDDFKGVMNWIVNEMEYRYETLGLYNCRTLVALNKALKAEGKEPVPYLVCIMDEFSDWIINAGQDVEKLIQRLASKARAAGIHLILAAQRPSSSVINGEIKANFDTRFAFKTSSFDDSKIILGTSGAEKLVGRGDLLLKYAGGEAERIQAAFISDDDGEISSIINKLRKEYGTDYIVDLEDIRRQSGGKYNPTNDEEGYDPLFEEVARFCVENNTGSNQAVMTNFNMGFPRANKLFADLERLGILSPAVKGKARDVLVGMDTLHNILVEEKII